jgi:hypothetical protein
MIWSKDNNMSIEKTPISKTCVINDPLINTVQNLLAAGWRKKEDRLFYKGRNTYIIELNGNYHPMWGIEITPINDGFDPNDWKLRKDLNSLKNLGHVTDRRLYLNDGNKEEIAHMISALQQNKFNLIYDNSYVVFRAAPNRVRIFKIAATMDLVEQPDGWYVGEKKIL